MRKKTKSKAKCQCQCSCQTVDKAELDITSNPYVVRVTHNTKILRERVKHEIERRERWIQNRKDQITELKVLDRRIRMAYYELDADRLEKINIELSRYL